MKKILLFLLTVLMMTQTAYAEFNDISDDPAKDKIEYLAQRGIVEGVGDNLFAPQKKVTRAEFVSMINRAMGYNEGIVNEFSDVNNSDWYYNDVNIAVNMGYINGYEDNTFKPNGFINHEQAVKILVEIYQSKYDLSPAGDMATYFTDYYDISDWARDYVKKGTMLSFAKGYNDILLFEPLLEINRSQAADMIYSLINTLEITKKADL